MKSGAPLRILLIEDSETDAIVLREGLAEIDGFPHEMDHLERLELAFERLNERAFDVVILDLGLPGSRGVETYLQFREKNDLLPVVVLTSLHDEEAGRNALRSGAQDYLTKDHLNPLLLARSLRYAVERHQIHGALAASREQLRLLAARQIQTREAERTHIAREVHDELGQMLTALKMDLRWLERHWERGEGLSDVAQRLKESQNLADRTIETVQRIALELRPSALDNLGLADAISDECRRFKIRTGLEMALRLEENFPPVDPEIATGCFRILQELLTNIIRHSRASRVDISLRAAGGQVEMTVRDNGTGLPSGVIGRSTSIGLLGMSERAVSLGGNICFEGAPKKGTLAVFRAPLHRS